MKIFLSWSGDRSKAAAEALREWLPLVLYYAQPWFSDRDIAAGDRWAIEIGKELEGTNFGIIVLTADNLTAPWILFEAGALSKAFTTTAVIPYLIDVEFKDLTGPLSQFQAKKFDRASTFDLLQSINTRSEAALDSQRLAQLFDVLWPTLQAKLKQLPAATAEPRPRSQAEVLEDLVSVVRRMDARIDQSLKPRRQRMPADGRSVRLVVDSEFPDIGDAKEMRFAPGVDLIEDIAGILRLDAAQYGSHWHLVGAASGKPITRLGTRGLAQTAHERPIAVILRKGSAEVS